MKTNVFLTGATGVMGMAALRHLTSPEALSLYNVKVLARPGKTNEKKLAPYIAKGVEVIWGDLMFYDDVRAGVSGADVVLHVGGMVSPAADWYPDKTLRVNVQSAHNIVQASLCEEDAGRTIKVVYIGSVSEYGYRPEGCHWGRTGDPVSVATFDAYAYSKCLAELEIIESGLSHWAVLRQTGIFHSGLLFKASDPISFHVPMRGVLEWVSADDSGRLLERVCRPTVPDTFWNCYYNIGGGATYRKMNYDFVAATLKAVGCPAPEKVFGLNWFVTSNFHGMWFTDSDLLDELLHFRSSSTFDEDLNAMHRDLPFYFSLAPLAPAALIRAMMKQVALKRVLGPLRWLKENNEKKIRAFWGSREEWEHIPEWTDADLSEPSRTPAFLDHGYDENKPVSELGIEDMRRAAEFRGGECLSAEMTPGDMSTPLLWRCAEGHTFWLTPGAVVKGGHWCGECLKEIYEDPEAKERQAARNPFLAQTI